MISSCSGRAPRVGWTEIKVGHGRMHISCSEGRGGDPMWHELHTELHKNLSDVMLILFTDCPTSQVSDGDAGVESGVWVRCRHRVHSVLHVRG
jgi:hypothetical protein